MDRTILLAALLAVLPALPLSASQEPLIKPRSISLSVGTFHYGDEPVSGMFQSKQYVSASGSLTTRRGDAVSVATTVSRADADFIDNLGDDATGTRDYRSLTVSFRVFKTHKEWIHGQLGGSVTIGRTDTVWDYIDGTNERRTQDSFGPSISGRLDFQGRSRWSPHVGASMFLQAGEIEYSGNGASRTGFDSSSVLTAYAGVTYDLPGRRMLTGSVLHSQTEDDGYTDLRIFFDQRFSRRINATVSAAYAPQNSGWWVDIGTRYDF